MATPFDIQAAVCPTLVGRALHLDLLHRYLARLQAGEGQVVTVAGEAGIGKSRLISETKREALQCGYLIIEGHGFEPDRSLPYSPLVDMLRSALGTSWLRVALERSPESAAELVKLLPELALRLLDVSPTPALEPEQEKRRLFRALARVFADAAAGQPLLVVIEDLHWSDATALEFLLYFARQVHMLPILLLMSYRDDEVDPDLEHLLAQLDRERLATELHLSRLATGEVDAMLRAILGLARPVRPGYLAVIYALTEGNPFFIEEIVRSLIAAGDIVAGDDGWDSAPPNELDIPRSVQDAVRRRSQRLSPAAQHVLALAAVAGRRFSFTLLSELAERDEAEMLALVKEMVAAHLIVEESVEQFAFRHALTRQAVYTQLLSRERRALHARIASTLERLSTAAPHLHLAELAYHTYEAGTWEKALAFAQRVGETAQAMHAPRAAAEHFTRALDAARQLGGAIRADLYQARGHAYEILGEFDRARGDYEMALAATRASSDQKGEWQALSDLGFLWAGREYVHSGEYFRHALALAEALAEPALRAHSLNRLGNWLVNVGQATEGLEAHSEALTIFEAHADRMGMAETLDLIAMANGLYGDLVAGVQAYDAAIALFRELGERRLLCSSLASRVVFAGPMLAETVAGALRTPDDITRDAAEAVTLALQLDWPAAHAYAEFTAGNALAAFGQFGAGLAHGRTGLRIAAEIDHQQWMAGSHCSLGQVYLMMLAPELAVEHLEAGLSLARAVGSAWWTGNISAYLALTYLTAGETGQAEAVLATLMPRDREPRNAPERRLAWAWAELCLAQGTPSIALALAERLIDSAPPSAPPQPIPVLLKLKAEALVALHQFEEAKQCLDDARRGALDRRAFAIVWQIARSLGNLYRQTGRDEAAGQAFAAARAGVETLAATIDDESLRVRFLAAALGSLPEAARVAAARAGSTTIGRLTVRECDVAALIAQGKSNRAIAEALVIGERTVETHISNILAKLGFSARTQIAAWAVANGVSSAEW